MGSGAKWIVAGVTIAGCALFACRQIAGIEDRSIGPVDAAGSNADGGDAGACSGGILFGAPACQTCVSQKCCAQASACGSNVACRAYETCLASCAGVDTCRSQCGLDHSVGTIASVPAIDACIALSCETECGLMCGGLVWDYVPGATQCAQCIQANACGEERACAQVEYCQAQERCRHACQTGDCFNACVNAHAGPGMNVEPAFETKKEPCRQECSLGSDWSCVGLVGYPLAKSTSVALTVAFVEFNGLTPLAGLDVAMCDPNNGCAPSVTTDGQGKVLLEEHPAAGQRGLEGYLTISSRSMAVVPALLYWSYPLSEPDATLLSDFSRVATGIPQRALFTPDALSARLATVGVAPASGRGHVVINAFDCSFRKAYGVTFTIPGMDGSSVAFDLVGGQAIRGATGTSGSGGFFNIPAGSQTVIVQESMGGKTSTNLPVTVVAGGVTYVEALPTAP